MFSAQHAIFQLFPYRNNHRYVNAGGMRICTSEDSYLFDSFTTIDEVEKDKSLPDIYIHAAEKLRVSNEDCIVFEDILAGVKGAKRAGMRVYGVYDFYSVHERSEIEEIVDGYITDFYELTKE